MNTIRCLLCKEKEVLKELYPASFDSDRIDASVFSARRTPDHLHYRIVRCQNCGLIFSNPIFDQDQIIDLYRESQLTYPEQIPYLQQTYGEYFQIVTKKLAQPHERLRVLEIGCGNGFFLERLESLGITELFGVEPSRAAVESRANSSQIVVINDVLSAGQFPEKSFDIVCCFHTLDHLVAPDHFLQLIYSLLKPGGAVFFIVHTTDGLSVRLFGERSPIFDIEHIYLFNQATITQLLVEQGFHQPEVFAIANYYPLSYWLRLTPLPVAQVIGRVLSTVGLDRLVLRFDAGNIGVIARK